MSTSAAERDIIIKGDTYDVEATCYEDQAHTNYNQYESRTPINPVAATASLWRYDTNEVVPLGEESDETACDITDNVVRFSVPSALTVEEGTYRLYLTIEFEGGMVDTVMREYRVKPRGV